MGTLDGKTAVVTGASSGIGLAIAQRLVVEGAHVFITGRRAEELEKAKAELGENVDTVQGDIASIDDLDRLYATIADSSDGVDVLVANAGVMQLNAGQDVSPDEFDRMFGVNAKGTFFTVQRSLPYLRDGASVVLMSSGLNVKGIPSFGVYAATKAAVRSFGRTWAAELKDRGIRVNVVSPGMTETPILDKQFTNADAKKEGTAAFAGITPLGRLARPQEIANAVYYLASDQSSYTTGFDLLVDGGIAEL